MKRWIITLVSACALASVATADIQAPPASEYTASRKLGRALSNILYGFVEIPVEVARKNETHGRKAGASYGLVNGTTKGLKRFGYGFYELLTFYAPTNNGTYKPSYKKCGKDARIEVNPTSGFTEFPPELGAESYYSHTRSTQW